MATLMMREQTLAAGTMTAVGAPARRPITRVGAPPSRLDVPDDLRIQLAAAVRRGEEAAQAWRRTHPGASEAEFAAAALARVAPPPVGAEQRAELDEIQSLVQLRSEKGLSVADYHHRYGGRQVWARYVDQLHRDGAVAQAQAAQFLLEEALRRTKEVNSTAKLRFARPRPFEQDPTLTTGVPRPTNNASYPSGHTSAAYAAALVLAGVMPERREELLDMAAQVAYSRMYGGVHFRSDVLAAAALASGIATDVLARCAAGTVKAATVSGMVEPGQRR